MSPELKYTLKQNNINIGVKNDIIYDYVPAPNNSKYSNIPIDPFFVPNNSQFNNYNGGSCKKKKY